MCVCVCLLNDSHRVVVDPHSAGGGRQLRETKGERQRGRYSEGTD